MLKYDGWTDVYTAENQTVNCKNIIANINISLLLNLFFIIYKYAPTFVQSG